MQVINVSNPSTPSLAGRCDTAYIASRLALSRDGTHAFVTDSISGLTLVDVRNPSSPLLLATLDTAGSAEGVAVSPDGRYAYVADGMAGLRVVAVSADPDGFSSDMDVVAVTIGGVNSPPTDVIFPVSSVSEGTRLAARLGAIFTTDIDFGDTFTYSLVSGVGSADNASFTIVGNELRTAAVFDYEAKNSYEIRLRSTDQGGLSYEKAFVISVTNSNDSPALSTAASPKLSTVAASVTTPANGSTQGSTLVSSLIDASGSLGNYSDPDSDQPGMAITGLNLQGGRLWFTTTSGATWREITQASDAAATLLYADTQTRLFYSPAQGFRGTIADAITFRAWDRSGGYSNGATSINTQPLLGPAGGSLATGGGADMVAMSSDGRYAYVIDQGLVIVDVSNPTSPVRIGSNQGLGDYRGVALSVDGRYAYVATGYTGLQVLDITNPANPIKVGSYNTVGFATKVVLSADGRYAYIADGDAGLRILDVSNPTAPKNVGGIGVNDWARGVAVTSDGRYAYIADWTAGLRIIDIRNPALPVFLGGFQTAGYVDGIALSADNKYLYCAVTSAGMQVVNVTNPLTPVSVGLCKTAQAGLHFALSPDGTRAFVADGSSGLTLVDIRNPSLPLLLTTYDTPGTAEGVAVAPDGRYAFVGDGGAGLRVIAIGASPSNFSHATDSITVVTNANPADISLSPVTAAENRPVGTIIGTLSTTDADAGDTFTYTLASGTGSTDNTSFAIVDNAIKTAFVFNYEAKSSYSVRVRSTDAGGLFTEKAFTITVTNVNEAPTDISLSASSVIENEPAATSVGTLSTTDPDAGNTFSYSLVTGTGSTDNAAFTVVNNTLATAASFNYEAKGSYSIRVRSTDADGLFTEKAIVVTVADMPNAIGRTQSVSGNAAVVFAGVPVRTYVAGEPGLPTGLVGDLNAPLTRPYALEVEGLNWITFSATGQWNNNSGADYGATGKSPDVTTSATYEYFGIAGLQNAPVGFLVGAFTGNTPSNARTAPSSRIDFRNGFVSMPALNQTFPIGGSSSRIQVPAGATRLYLGMHDAYIWSDNWGSLTVTISRAYEAPTDIAVSASSVAENQSLGTAVGELSTSDPDVGDTFAYTLVSGPGSMDNASFAIAGNQLRTAASFNYEAKSDYLIRVRSTDAGGLFTEKAFSILITNVNESPNDISLSLTSVAENRPSGTTVGILSTVDPDAANTFTYSLVGGDGAADNTFFSISGNSLKTASSLNFEAKSTYSIRVRSADSGGLFTEKAITINVVDVIEDWNVVISDGMVQIDDSIRNGSSRLVKSGTGSLILDRANVHTGGIVVQAGNLIVRNTQALGAGRLWVKPGASVLFEVGHETVTVSSLTLESGGAIDIGYGQLSIDPLGCILADVQGWLRTGYRTGFESGPDIRSRFASASSGRTVGYTVNWDGSITVGYAAMGDTNLSGDVDILDMANLLSSGKFDSGDTATWPEGDFNYDGLLDVLDLADFFTTNLFNRGSYRFTAEVSAALSPQSIKSTVPTELTASNAVFVAFAIESSSNVNRNVKKTRTAVG
jgi:autotransporter-associated beta strand protein